MRLAPRRRLSGRWFEQFQAGEILEHAVTRTVTETDNAVQLPDDEPAADAPGREFSAVMEFGKPLMNSMFAVGLVVGIAVPKLTLGTTIANLGMEDASFPNPVTHGTRMGGDRGPVHPRLQVPSRPEAGIVKVEHRGYNQRDELVCRCRRTLARQAEVRHHFCVLSLCTGEKRVT